MKNRGHKLIAIICRTASQCRVLHRHLRPSLDIGLISNQNEVYHGDCFVIPSYLAKGLEFDAVLVPAVDGDYNFNEDRQLLYTVCTRALHELYLYYFDEMPGIISGVDEELYDIEDKAR